MYRQVFDCDLHYPTHLLHIQATLGNILLCSHKVSIYIFADFSCDCTKSYVHTKMLVLTLGHFLSQSLCQSCISTHYFHGFGQLSPRTFWCILKPPGYDFSHASPSIMGVITLKSVQCGWRNFQLHPQVVPFCCHFLQLILNVLYCQWRRSS